MLILIEIDWKLSKFSSNDEYARKIEINKVFANSTLVEQHQLDIPREQTCVEYLITIGYKLLMG